MIKFKLEGFDKLDRDMRTLGKVPQTAVNKAAKEGAKVMYAAAQAGAPVRTGSLKKGIILHKEKKVKPAKAVFDAILDPAMNGVFVKTVLNPTTMNRSNDPTRAYYPSSQEAGFYNHWAGRFLPGLHYLRNAIDSNKQAIEDAVLNSMQNSIDKALRGGGK